MKYIAPIAAAALTITSANAGTLTEPVIEEVETVEAGSSSGGILLPLLLLGAVALVVASGDDDEVPTTPTED